MKDVFKGVGGAILAVILLAVIIVGSLFAARAIRGFNVETDRLVTENSRQYVITQQTRLSNLAADCADVQVDLAEAIDDDADGALLATYENQIDSIDREIATVSALIDAEDIPQAAIGGCR